MLIVGKNKTNEFWTERTFWAHLFILFSIFVYLYSPLLDYARGQHVHSRQHTHIPVKLLRDQPQYHHLHHIGDGHNHSASEEADDYICTLEFDGLILLTIFATFETCIHQPIRNVFIYTLELDGTDMILKGRPPPNPPPRLLA